MEEKRKLRRRVWGALIASDTGRFPGVEGRIPNFRGAEDACRALAELPAWRKARIVKANPDLPQRTARHLALKDGKRLYIAVPRLAAEAPFLELDPARLDEASLWQASSIRGAQELGRPVTLAEMEPIDLVLCGAVAVAPDGARLGKGGGYSDLEFALLRESELVGARTPVVSLVHALQVLADGEIPMLAHDVPLDGYATPEGMVRCARTHRRPRGVILDELGEERRAAIPALADRTAGAHAPEKARQPAGARRRSEGGT